MPEQTRKLRGRQAAAGLLEAALDLAFVFGATVLRYKAAALAGEPPREHVRQVIDVEAEEVRR